MDIILPIGSINSKISDITTRALNTMFMHRRMINDLRFIQSLFVKYIFIENCKSETGWDDNFLNYYCFSKNKAYLCSRYQMTMEIHLQNSSQLHF